jgi:hypothetical protein
VGIFLCPAAGVKSNWESRFTADISNRQRYTVKYTMKNTGKGGMFAVLGNFVDGMIELAARGDVLVPQWRSPVYATPDVDSWDLFFERVGHTCDDIAHARPHRVQVRTISPRGPQLPPAIAKRYGKATALFVPTREQRLRAHPVINEYVVLKEYVRRAIDDFWDRHLKGRDFLALHIRGPGRLHGGVPLFNEMLGVPHPPYSLYFDLVDQRISGDSAILVCTDAGCVQQEVIKRYGRQRVICTTNQLAHGGETHLSDEYGGRAEVGVDALKDAYLMARAGKFVHGNSNASNWVRCLDPDLDSVDIYQSCYDELARRAGVDRHEETDM